MGPTLTIRNCSTTPLQLNVLERYKPPGHTNAPKGLAGFPKNMTDITNLSRGFTNMLNVTSPDSPQLASDASSFGLEKIDIRVEAFRSVKTNIGTKDNPNDEILRLTFTSYGNNEEYKHRVDLPTAPTKSAVAVSLSDHDSPHAFNAIYHPQFGHISIISTANLNSWQRELKDSTSLSAMSMPGTHNSPTCHTALPSVRCQAVGVRAQLDNGVRFLDVRCQPDGRDLILVHGVFPISLTGNKYLRELLRDVYEFLDANPSETVIVSLKREGRGESNDQDFSLIVRDEFINKDEHKWYTLAKIPRLGECRGKAVLFRRYAIHDQLRDAHGPGSGYGINAENWAYNTANCVTGGGDICVQDFCEVLETENIDTKIKYVCEQLERSGAVTTSLLDEGEVTSQAAVGEGQKQPIFINFLSASNFWKVGCWPDKIAAKLNPAVVDFLARMHGEPKDVQGGSEGEGMVGAISGDGGTGVVVCDYVGENGDWNLCRLIVAMNGKLEMREKGH